MTDRRSSSACKSPAWLFFRMKLASKDVVSRMLETKDPPYSVAVQTTSFCSGPHSMNGQNTCRTPRQYPQGPSRASSCVLHSTPCAESSTTVILLRLAGRRNNLSRKHIEPLCEPNSSLSVTELQAQTDPRNGFPDAMLCRIGSIKS